MMRTAAGVMLALVLLWAAGCTSFSSLSGGSVPIGDIDGAVYYSTRGTQTLARVPVLLRDGTGHVLQATVSDTQGQFAFSNVPSGDVEVISTQGALSGQVHFTMQEGVHARVVLMIAAVDHNVVKLKIQSAKPGGPDGSIDLDEEENNLFTVMGEDANGHPIPNLPVSWVVVGDIGEVSPDGHFNAKKEGDGELIVQHNGVDERVKIRVHPGTGPP